MEQLYYDIWNDKAYRVVHSGPMGIHFKPVKINTGRAKMGEGVKVLSPIELINFSKGFIPIKKANNIPYVKQLHETLINKLETL